MRKEQRDFYYGLLKLLSEQQQTAVSVQSGLKEANEYLSKIAHDARNLIDRFSIPAEGDDDRPSLEARFAFAIAAAADQAR